MLQDKYLPEFHFAEKHTLVVHAPPSKIFPLVEKLDFERSWVIGLLFKLRGMPASMMSLEGLNKGKFITLEILPNEEIIIGIIGQFWKPAGNLLHFRPDEFVSLSPIGFAKASWSFRLISMGNETRIDTETRIFCTEENCRKKFSRYWFVIRPFSGLVRKEILKSIRKKAEAMPL